MRKKFECIITLVVIFIFISCLVAVDFALADHEGKSKELKVSYYQVNTSSTAFADMLESLASFREDIADVIDYINPLRADQMGKGNDLLHDVISIIEDMNQIGRRRPFFYTPASE